MLFKSLFSELNALIGCVNKQCCIGITGFKSSAHCVYSSSFSPLLFMPSPRSCEVYKKLELKGLISATSDAIMLDKCDAVGNLEGAVGEGQ